MSEDESFIDDSDGDVTPPQWRPKREDTAILSETDEEFDEESDDVPSGRMTPSIKKAIRRSIFNMSHHATDSDEVEDEDEDEDEDEGEDENIQNGDQSHEISHSLDESDSEDEEAIPTQRKRITRIADSSDDQDLPDKSQKSLHNSSDFRITRLLDSSNEPEDSHITSLLDSTSEEDQDNGVDSKISKRTPGSHKKSLPNPSTTKTSNKSRHSDSFTIENSSSDEETPPRPPPPKHLPKSAPRLVRKSPQIRPSFIVSSDEETHDLPSTSKPAEIISIDSDTPSDSEHLSNSTGEAAAMSLAQQELGLSNIDPLLAQRRALLAIEIQNNEAELLRMKHFVSSGNHLGLPDKGAKFLENTLEAETKIQQLRKELSKYQLVEQGHMDSSKDDSLSFEDHAREKDALHNNSDYIPYNSEEESPRPKAPAFNNTLLNRPTTAPMGDLGRKALETYQRDQALTIDTLKSFHGSLNSRPAEDEQADDPRGLKVTLMGHQKHALAWLMWREHQKPPGGVLADDMGLGKTLTMISLVLKTMEAEDSGGESDEEWHSKRKSSKPHGGTLIVCPASLVGQWENEVTRRCKKGLLNVELYHGTKRENVPKRLAKNDMVITTYNLVSREHKANGVLFKVNWKRVILDEGHVIRNHKSQSCESVCALEAKRRWVLTGTPIHNKEMDLFSVLKFLQCAPFNDIRVWKRWVDNKNQAGHERLATVMKTLMLRRTKQELMNSGAVENLPDKSMEIIWVELDSDERLVYDKVMLYSKHIFAQFLHQRAEKEHMMTMGAGYERPLTTNKNPFNKAQQRLLAQHAQTGDVKAHQILTLFLRLRQICFHPSLIEAMLDKEEIEQTGLDDDMEMTQRMAKMNINGFGGDEEVPDGPAEVDDRVAEHLLTSDNPVFERSRESSKLKAVLDRLQKILKMDEKVIIVSQWTSVLDIIGENMKKEMKNVKFQYLTGAVQVKDRGAIVDSFNYEKEPRVLLLSLTAGGVGLNLVGANHLMLVDIHWNPQLESQAQDRIYRFGQKKNVFIYKFLCSDTIEEKIKEKQDQKLELANNLLSGSGKIQSAKLTMDDLRSMFGL